jgi:3-phenylpropionate/trans-cinnamate dioxygenase ferredoxin component
MSKCRQNKRLPRREGRWITVGRAEQVPDGQSARVRLLSGGELALFNVEGKFSAVENFCPHKGAPLAGSPISGTRVECYLHGWQFNVRTGKCLTKKNCSIESYKVEIKDGWIRIMV